MVLKYLSKIIDKICVYQGKCVGKISFILLAAKTGLKLQLCFYPDLLKSNLW